MAQPCGLTAVRQGREKGGASAEESLITRALGRSRGGFSTKIHVLCEGAGLPISVLVTPGQANESTMLEALLSSVRIAGKPGAPRRHFDTISGDKGYDGAAQRATVREHGLTPLILHRKRNGAYPSDAEDFDKVLYKKRNVVERLIGKLKEFRRIATRYDKLAESLRSSCHHRIHPNLDERTIVGQSLVARQASYSGRSTPRQM